MTPYEIGILLHYYARVDDHADIASNVRPRTIDWFIGQELLVPSTTPQAAYAITERGRAYVDALQAVQLPVKRWVFPGLSECDSH